MLLDSRLRRRATYLYVQDLLSGASVLDVAVDAGDAAALLAARGAKSVRQARPEEVASVAPGFDVAFVLDAEPAGLGELVAAVKRALKPEGTLVVGVASKDRPGARAGLSYYEMLDLLEKQFPSVKMVGQAPFAAATLVEYGVAEPDPVLDATLVPKGERVENYVAVAGPKRDKQASRGYGVMQVPLAEVGALPAERRVAPVESARPAPPPPKPQAPAAQPVAKAPPAPGVEELKSQLAAAQKGKGELLDFVRDLQRQLGERDAYAAELDGERREIARLREATRLAEARADKAEAKERDARKQLAVAEGQIVALRSGAPIPVAAAAAGAADNDELGKLRAEVEKLRQKEADARAEAWKALKQRADAEAAASEVREDTVRKLKDARKLASVELTRATEEAMKKAVTLKEELARTERERKELIAEVKRLTAELEAAKAAPRETGETEAMRARDTESLRTRETEALRTRIAGLERELMNADAIAAADRARAAQLLADVEAEVKERADAGVRVRHALRERDREVAALRHELSDRDARLTALEQRTPVADEVERLEAELATTRARLQALTQELARKEAQVERAAAAAAHERARAERLLVDERRTVEERNQSRARAAESARQLEEARERLARLEAELRGEAERVGALEEAVVRVAETARNNGHSA
jgi:chromosome segregation ATPase